MRDLMMERNSGRVQNFLRMTDTDFEYLLQLLSPLIVKQDTHLRKSISPKERLLIAIRFISTGESFNDLSYIARASPHIISPIVMEVCAALIEILRDQIQVSFLFLLH